MRKLLLASVCTSFLCSCSSQDEAPEPEIVGEWHHAGGTHFSEKYAPLDQVNAENFGDLEIAWRWQSIDVNLPRNLAYATGDYRACLLYTSPSPRDS